MTHRSTISIMGRFSLLCLLGTVIGPAAPPTLAQSVGPFAPGEVLRADKLNAELANAAQANQGDGVVLIDQARAEAGGPGDKPGFPITIGADGSYRLTSNLLVPGNANAFEIIADRVTLDLNGFSIQGAGSGVTRNGTGPKTDIAVINGTIAMQGGGINLSSAERCRVENLRVTGSRSGFGIVVSGGTGGKCLVIGNVVSNSQGGISGGDGSVVRSNTVVTTGTDGAISCGDGCVISGNTSMSSMGNGFTCGAHCVVSDNTSFNNKGIGIQVGEGSRVNGNTVNDNQDTGISARVDTSLVGNTVVSDNTVNNNVGIGIEVGPASRVNGNTVNDNQNTGISAALGSLVIDNTVVHTGNVNTFSGIVARRACVVRGNTVANNGGIGINVDDAGLVSGNSLDRNGIGINVGGNGGGTVLGNSVSNSTGVGLQTTTNTGYAQNVFNNNNGSNGNAQVSGGIQIGTNACGGDPTCP